MAHHISADYQEEDISADYQEEEISADYQEEDISADYQEEEISADYQEEDISADYQEEDWGAGHLLSLGPRPFRCSSPSLDSWTTRHETITISSSKHTARQPLRK